MTLRRLFALLCIGMLLVAVLVPMGVPVEIVAIAVVVAIAARRSEPVAIARPLLTQVLPTHLPRAALS